MNDGGWARVCQQCGGAFPVSYVEGVMVVSWYCLGQPFQIPRSVTLGPKEYGPLIVVDTVNFVALLTEEFTYFGSY